MFLTHLQMPLLQKIYIFFLFAYNITQWFLPFHGQFKMNYDNFFNIFPYAYLMTRLSTIKKKKSTATLSLPSFCKKCPEDPLIFFMSTFVFFRNECSFGTDEKLVDDDSLILLFRPYGCHGVELETVALKNHSYKKTDKCC